MMDVVYIVLIAFVADLVFGDPRCLPHPVVAIACIASMFEKIFRATLSNKLYVAGILTTFFTLLATTLAVYSLLFLFFTFSYLAGCVLSVILIYFSLATKSLVQHSKAVYSALSPHEDIILAREKVAMIVGRETSDLNAEKVIKATVESVAENLVDGITAPLMAAVFLSFLGTYDQSAVMLAAVGAMAYKSVNTMDSMFGYKNERYCQFGWAAARLDDLANFVPARITALLILLCALIAGKNALNGSRIFLRDRLNHLSPNAGHTEAAVAGVLGLQFGGAAMYHGRLVEKPYIGDKERDFSPSVILEANNLVLLTSVVTMVLLAVLLIIIKVG